MGRRIDAVVLVVCVVFVIEFKVGASNFEQVARLQVWDCADGSSSTFKIAGGPKSGGNTGVLNSPRSG